MRKGYIVVFAAFSLFQLHCSSSKKTSNSGINEQYIVRVETALSHDSMEGRKTLTPGIEKAAAFIANEMKTTGLKSFNGASNYYQTFTLISPSIRSAAISFGDSADTNPAHVYCSSSQPTLHIDMNSGYKVVRIANEDEFSKQARALSQSKENVWVLLDKSLDKRLARMKGFSRYTLPQANNIVFCLVPDVTANHYSIDITQNIKEGKTSNVIGVLPGKKYPDEYVIFSGHYDHLGYSRPDDKGDSLYNGANDDASGVTAMLALAKHFAQLKNNERSILFVAFTAEELGTLGSEYFGSTIDANKVVAMFNIEMIGTPSKWGNNSAYITGYERSDLGIIMQKNTDSTRFKFYPDPYTKYNLFYRSDNASMAKRGVPAHTISTSQMDQEPHYHKASDEVSTLDLNNMTNVIKAIAEASSGVINKKDTPSRIPPLEN